MLAAADRAVGQHFLLPEGAGHAARLAAGRVV